MPTEQLDLGLLEVRSASLTSQEVVGTRYCYSLLHDKS